MTEGKRRERGEKEVFGTAGGDPGRALAALANLDRTARSGWSGEYELTGLKVKLGYIDHTDTMVIVTALDGQGAPVVAFHSANLPSEAIMGAVNRFLNGGLKWRDDEYAK